MSFRISYHFRSDMLTLFYFCYQPVVEHILPYEYSNFANFPIIENTIRCQSVFFTGLRRISADTIVYYQRFINYNKFLYIIDGSWIEAFLLFLTFRPKSSLTRLRHWDTLSQPESNPTPSQAPFAPTTQLKVWVCHCLLLYITVNLSTCIYVPLYLHVCPGMVIVVLLHYCFTSL